MPGARVGFVVTVFIVAIVACGRSSGERATVLLVNGTVLTGERTGTPRAVSVAVLGERIAALGDSGALHRWIGPETEIVDLGGHVLAPAFVDHHVHLLNMGFALLNAREGERLFLDLSSITSLEELVTRIRERVRGVPRGSWILGAGWNQAAWGTETLPTHEFLSRAAPHHPVFLTRTDGHAGWVNTTAMRMVGIDERSTDPAGGAILRFESGQPTGVLLERANEAVLVHIPPPSDEDVTRAFRLATAAMAARGVSEVFDAGFLAVPSVVALNVDFRRYLTLLANADLEQPLGVAVNLMVPAPSDLAEALTSSPDVQRASSPRVRITHLKLFADGALGSRGAALTHPYGDDPTVTGVPRMTEAEIEMWARRALGVGLDVATHAIGDEAVRRTLDAYERLLTDDPHLDPRRLRIEHFSYAREADFERVVRLGIVISMQSNFNSLPGDIPSFGERRVGAAGATRVYAWRTLGEMGGRLAEGSDYFTMPGAPLLGFHAALTRQNALGAWGSGAAGRERAFRLMTMRYPAGGGDPRPAVIRAGSRADLQVLSANPLTVLEDSLLEVRVLATFLAGKRVYDAGVLRTLPPVSDVATRSNRKR